MRSTDTIAEKYDTIYKRKENAFGSKPYPLVNDLLLFKNKGTVLDLGCGDGRNALFLARNGFSVTAVDFANSGLSKIENCALKENLSIKIQSYDIRKNLYLEEDFDIVLMTFVSQYLTLSEFSSLVRRAQERTRFGGMHILGIINKASQYAHSNKAQRWNFLSADEVLSLYKNWEILKNYRTCGKILSKIDDVTVDKGKVVADNLILKKI